MEWVLGILVGISLSAASGFRVFIPMLVMSIAVHSGYLDPASGFEWLGSWVALFGFGLATVIEIVAYFVPVVSNALDVIATPAAVVAGTILSASMIGEISPVLRWVLAIVAGGGVAAGVHVSTAAIRTTVSPIGGSPIFSVMENGASLVTSLLAVTLPILAAILLVSFSVFVFRRKHKRANRV